jgi:2-keto-4-pentenoate hydratase
MTASPSRTAQWLLTQHRERRTFRSFPAGIRPASLSDAYLAQARFVDLKARDCGAPVGWKIALSNPAMQRMVGLDAPVAGRLLSGQVVAGPASTRVGAYGRLLIEFEIAVELGADLPAPGGRCSREQAHAAVAAVRPAFELADDRDADYARLGDEAFQLVADNAWNEGAVLGMRREDWAGLDLEAIVGRVFCDDVPVGSGRGGDLMGHPLDALAWLAGSAASRGLTMRRGDVAILGSLVTSRFPKAGERWRFELDGFEPLRLSIEP